MLSCKLFRLQLYSTRRRMTVTTRGHHRSYIDGNVKAKIP
jgi:hypothetical protein